MVFPLSSSPNSVTHGKKGQLTAAVLFCNRVHTCLKLTDGWAGPGRILFYLLSENRRLWKGFIFFFSQFRICL